MADSGEIFQFLLSSLFGVRLRYLEAYLPTSVSSVSLIIRHRKNCRPMSDSDAVRYRIDLPSESDLVPTRYHSPFWDSVRRIHISDLEASDIWARAVPYLSVLWNP